MDNWLTLEGRLFRLSISPLLSPNRSNLPKKTLKPALTIPLYDQSDPDIL